VSGSVVLVVSGLVVLVESVVSVVLTGVVVEVDSVSVVDAVIALVGSPVVGSDVMLAEPVPSVAELLLLSLLLPLVVGPSGVVDDAVASDPPSVWVAELLLALPQP